MRHLIILGAGGFGREVFCAAEESIGYGTEFDIKGFLDDRSTALDGFEGYAPVLGSIDAYEINDGDIFICALGNVKTKKLVVEKILAKGGEFMTLVHKDAYVGKNVKIGKGCILLAGSRLHCDITIGDFVTLQPYAILGHDVIVGNWSHINAYADCGGASRVGEMVTLHTTSFILPQSIIEDGATVGAGSVVLRKVKKGMTVIGVPAKPVLTPSLKQNNNN